MKNCRIWLLALFLIAGFSSLASAQVYSPDGREGWRGNRARLARVDRDWDRRQDWRDHDRDRDRRWRGNSWRDRDHDRDDRWRASRRRDGDHDRDDRYRGRNRRDRDGDRWRDRHDRD
jgi:hypothetical protein